MIWGRCRAKDSTVFGASAVETRKRGQAQEMRSNRAGGGKKGKGGRGEMEEKLVVSLDQVPPTHNRKETLNGCSRLRKRKILQQT